MREFIFIILLFCSTTLFFFNFQSAMAQTKQAKDKKERNIRNSNVKVCIPECTPECKKKCLANVKDSILGNWTDIETGGITLLHYCKKDKKLLCGIITGDKEPENWPADARPPAIPGKKITDINNPDPEKRNSKVRGMQHLEGLTWNSVNQSWENGTIYNPLNGKFYGASIKLVDAHTAKLWGHLKCCKLLGKNVIWTRP